MVPDIVVGALGFGARARVDGHGAVTGDELAVDWWVGADDRWHFPAEEASTHRHRPSAAPIVETSVRVPGGEAAQRVYGATAEGNGTVVIEVENRSPAPFTLALVVDVARSVARSRARSRT